MGVCIETKLRGDYQWTNWGSIPNDKMDKFRNEVTRRGDTDRHGNLKIVGGNSLDEIKQFILNHGTPSGYFRSELSKERRKKAKEQLRFQLSKTLTGSEKEIFEVVKDKIGLEALKEIEQITEGRYE